MLKKKIREGHSVTASQDDVDGLKSPSKNQVNRSKSEKKGVKLRKNKDLKDLYDSEEEDLLGEISV